MISGDTTLGRLLDEHPELIEVLASYHPHFRQLRNRLLRKVMAPRVTIGQAARIAGLSTNELLQVLGQALGEPAAEEPHSERGGAPEHPSADHTRRTPVKPGVLEGIPESALVYVDVRADLSRGDKPFARIMRAVRAMAPDQVLVLRVPFEPMPLYEVLRKRGFSAWPEYRGDGDWVVWFYREPGRATPSLGEAETVPGGADRGTPAASPAPLRIDVRSLEPPQPMVRILEALEALGDEGELEVIHDRRPMFLYPQLDDRGFAHETEDVAPAMVRIRIRRGRGSR
jgi:uncharacterized protein (DUF2249 family)